jgi:hypothetical protein
MLYPYAKEEHRGYPVLARDDRAVRQDRAHVRHLAQGEPVILHCH